MNARLFIGMRKDGELEVRDVTDATLDPDETLYETCSIFVLSASILCCSRATQQIADVSRHVQSVISQIQPEKELPHLVAQINSKPP